MTDIMLLRRASESYQPDAAATSRSAITATTRVSRRQKR
jgi:hypothetical protein